MRCDDEISYASNKSRGSRSLPGDRAFAIDWDEIDSIAEESLSVCSSASGHRKRKNAKTLKANQQRRSTDQSYLDALEAGSLSGFSNSRSRGRSSNSNSPTNIGDGKACNAGNKSVSKVATTTLPNTRTSKKRSDASRRMLANAKRLVVIGGLAMLMTCSIHFFGSYLKESLTASAVSFSLGDLQIRRLVKKTIGEHNLRHWPVSVRDEESDFELITHPGNSEMSLSVPRFFLTKDDGSMQPLSAGNGMTKSMSEMVGRTTVGGSLDFSVRTIYVGVASFRDWHCRYTVESIFSRAKYPERIRVGVVDQLEAAEDQSCDVPIVPCQQKPDQALCRYRDQIDVYEMEAKLAVGPTFARHVVNRMYRGEYYNLQIDSHTVFVKYWDVDLIEQLDSTGNEMAVITTYLADALGSIDDMSGSAIRKSRQVICNAAYEGAGKDRFLRHDRKEQPDALPGITGSPQLQPFWSADFSFSRGHFVLSVPYDPLMPMLQQDDEEISMGIRAFTKGYDFYTPERNVCFDSAFSDNDSRLSYLDHKYLYEGLEEASLKRMHGILGMEDENEEAKYINNPNELYSIGKVRDIFKYWNSFGIHAKERITERKLCNFVSPGHMHSQFHKYLKADGMGLDYSKIAFRFHELQNNHEA